jgi:hypothetical protein
VTPGALLAEFRSLGVTLGAEGGRLLYTAPRGTLGHHLRAEAKRCRRELLALVAAGQGIPSGTRLFFVAADARPCWPDGPHKQNELPLHMWTWQGGPGWVYAADIPPPPHGPALWPRHRRRCPSCDGRDLGISWQTCVNSEKRLQVRCVACRAHVAYLAVKPHNPELEWLAS